MTVLKRRGQNTTWSHESPRFLHHRPNLLLVSCGGFGWVDFTLCFCDFFFGFSIGFWIFHFFGFYVFGFGLWIFYFFFGFLHFLFWIFYFLGFSILVFGFFIFFGFLDFSVFIEKENLP